MALSLSHGYPTILIRRDAYERSGLTRAAIDERLGLTDDEFRVTTGLIAIGPLVADADVSGFVADLEDAGLVWFEDFFELTGNWPAWLVVHAAATSP